MKKLSKIDIELICEYLGQLAVKEAEQGNAKRKKRIFALIDKLKGTV